MIDKYSSFSIHYSIIPNKMRKLFALIMAVGFLLSCKKEEDTIAKGSYLPLKVGNYWIYQEFMIDTSGIETANSILDSVVINRDTIINHKKYYVLEGNYPYPHRYQPGIIEYLRDSSSYIVNQNGIVRFAENDFTDTLAYRAEINIYDNSDTLFVLSYQMERINIPITVPAGTFEVLNCKGTVVTSMNTPGIKWPRYTNNYYAKGVGKIMETYFYIASPVIYEKRLLRYFIE
jgi:hypothetical protein